MRRFLCLFSIISMIQLATGAAVPTESAVLKAESEAKALAETLAEVRRENKVLETRCETLKVTADLISGRRSSPPEMTLVEREVQRPFEGKKVLDNRADGRAMVEKSWLKLPGTGHYRVRARIAIHEISGTKNFKFGCMVPTKGAGTKWPAAFVGGAPFAEKELSFDFDFPEDASALLLVGFESGKGLAEFGDVTVSRIEEFCR